MDSVQTALVMKDTYSYIDHVVPMSIYTLMTFVGLSVIGHIIIVQYFISKVKKLNNIIKNQNEKIENHIYTINVQKELLNMKNTNDTSTKMKKFSKDINVVVYIEKYCRHFTGVISDVNETDETVCVKFYDYRMPYTIKTLNDSDIDNGYFKISNVSLLSEFTNSEHTDHMWLFPIEPTTYDSYVRMLKERYVLALLRIQTVDNFIYYKLLKSKNNLSDEIYIMMKNKKTTESYYKNIVPLMTQTIKTRKIDDAYDAIIVSFGLRFEFFEGIANDSFIGEQEEMIEEFNAFYVNHENYVKDT